MNFFDEIVNRKNTDSLKYDFCEKYGKPQDAIPLWVADMDFRTVPEVTAALHESVNHAIYGYTETKEDYFNAVKNWFTDVHDYHIQKEWLVKVPGIVFAIAMAIRAYTNENDTILIQKPLYYPIAATIKANRRKVADNTLIYANGKYSIDFEDFEKKIAENSIKMFILCNPHNPVGRVWTKEELQSMGEICRKYGVMVVSDEIHCDIVFKGHKHLVFSNICPYLDSVICTSPSKTFNLAGLQCANIFIENTDLKKKFTREIEATGYSQLNTLGLKAGQIAYEHGRNWHKNLMDYLSKNAEYVKNFLAEKMPKVHAVALEGTYLLWLDFNGLGLSHKQLDEIITNKAKLWLSDGTIFGETGAGFFRVNLGCPKHILEKAMRQLETAFV